MHSMRGKSKKWMTIKIDLEKAYDKVRWDFIETFMEHAGIPNSLSRLIMSAITSFTMQILWNGLPTEKFKPAIGVRQSCLLSPYLFVLCMEWLGRNIRESQRIENWKPIKLARSRPALSHLFFVDDLIIFFKADVCHGNIIKTRASFVTSLVTKLVQGKLIFFSLEG